VAADTDHIVINNANTVKTFAIKKGHPAVSVHEDVAERIKLLRVFESFDECTDQAMCRQFIQLIEQAEFSLEYLIPVFVRKSDIFRSGCFTPFIQKLYDTYGDYCIYVNGVDMLLSQFICAQGMVTGLGTDKKKKERTFKTSKNEYECYYALSDQMQIIEIKEGRTKKAVHEFYLASNYDQILCVHESGAIQWKNNLFLNCFKAKAAITPGTDQYRDVCTLARSKLSCIKIFF
jgi:hypothetical protein